MLIKKDFINEKSNIRFLLFVSACSYFESETEQANRLSKTYQVDIKTDDPKESYPEEFSNKDATLNNVNITRTTLKDASDTLDGIESALSVYPKGFVSEVIDVVYISSSIKIEGAAAGGLMGLNG
nr:hypothetical protein [Ningiella sp. W23]